VRRGIAGIEALQRALLAQAEAGADWVMPGFTHLQTAQPVTWGHHMMAYVEMLGRDAGASRDARARMNECPLGAAALAGTSFPIDRHMTAEALGFDRPMANSLDAVSATATSRSSSCGRLDLRHAPEPLRRGAGDLVLGPVPLRRAVGPVLDRLLDHAAEEEPRRGRADPGQDRAHPRGDGRAPDGDEGPAARLFQGHAGGQGAGLRRRRQPDAGARRDGGHGARHDRQTRRAARGRASGFSTATDLADWLVRGSACRSARRITSPARWWRWPSARAATCPT
jgi:hypothetical protein